MNPLQQLILKWAYRWKRRRERTYLIDDVPVVLPAGHLLDWYQCLHPRYDRFLSVLAGEMTPDSVVLDIGANIGDSAVPFLRRGMRTWCVEPAAEFLDYLHRNLKGNDYDRLAVVIDRLITSSTSPLGLKVERGTAFVSSPQSGENIDRTMTLNALLEKMGGVDLIKSDTDGFDHDVLNSGQEQIGRFKPLLYFENTVDDQNQAGYEALYQRLDALGYDRIVLFDNRGNVLQDPATWEDLRQINHRIMRGTLPNTPYLDILCGTPKHYELINAALRIYQGQL
jgi:FkbM family methyltransferase